MLAGAAALINLCAASPLAGQSLPISVSAGAHALSVPWQPGAIGYRFNPAILVGTDRTLRGGERWSFYQTANLGFFQHHWWMTGLSLDTELGLSRALPLGLSGDLRFGLGYLHYFWRRKTLEIRDGEWRETGGWGRPSLVVPLSLLLGYRERTGRPLAAAPFVLARWSIQVLLIEEASVMPHLQLLAGVRLHQPRNVER